MRRCLLVLPAAALACASAPAIEASPPARVEPWQQVDVTCARDDDPRHIERIFVGEDRREQLIVPVRVQPALTVPLMWSALGAEVPDIAPLRWRHLLLESAHPTGRWMRVDVARPSPDVLTVTVVPVVLGVSGWAVDARIERRRDGTLIAALGVRGRLDDLAGELRLSEDTWNEPGRTLAIHLEVGWDESALCARFQVEIPPPGERRRLDLPIATLRP